MRCSNIAAKAVVIAVIAGFGGGCANEAGWGNHTARETAASNSFAVTGRDLGRGGATSGGVSSLDQGGNAADYSLYEESRMGR